MAIITKKDGSFTYSLDTNTGKFKIEQNVGKETHKTNIDWTLPEENEKAWKAILGKIPTDQKGQWIKGAGKTGESQEAEKEVEEEEEEDEDEDEAEEGVWTKKSKLEDFKAVPFVDRILNPKNYPNAYDVKVGGGIETHNLTVTKLRGGDWAVYPTLQYRKNKLIYRTIPENNNLIKFESETEEELDRFLSACMAVNSKQHTKVLIHRSANNVNLAMDESIIANIVRTIGSVVEVLYVQKLTAIQ